MALDKQRIRESMISYLKNRGWTPGNDQLVIDSLPGLWRKLLKEGLLEDATRRGFNFKDFCHVANTMKIIKEFNMEFRY